MINDVDEIDQLKRFRNPSVDVINHVAAYLRELVEGHVVAIAEL